MSNDEGKVWPDGVVGQRSPRWAFWSWFTIPDKNDKTQVYLRRLRIIQTPLFGIYLHWIYLPDSDRDPHDHPWNFYSFIVRGGYTEYVYHQLAYQYTLKMRRATSAARMGFPDRIRTWGRFTIHRTDQEIAHKIVHLKPGTITLIFTGRRDRNWGFWTEQGFVPWQQYVDEGKN